MIGIHGLVLEMSDRRMGARQDKEDINSVADI
jgi:hypothetical protein